MRDVNKIILIGRLGADPIQRTTKNGNPVVNFSVATSRKFKAAAGMEESEGDGRKWEEETQWHQVVVWGKQGEYCAEYLRKGHGVYLEGSLRSRQYEAKDGSQRTVFEVHADDVRFLSRPYRKREDAGGIAEEQPELLEEAG
jgi:single-strand DNA-binding protein